MSNIKFSYLYRDGSNYKKYDSVVFSNPDGIDVAELENLIRSKLIDGEFFYATEWSLPEFFTEYVDFRIDPTWHEFVALAYTDEPANALCGLVEFMELIGRTGEYGFVHR